jgi:hypothetical protein
MPAKKTKTEPVACGACGATDKTLTIVATPGGANETVACLTCASSLFTPAGFEIL